jgi:hypothetical protein
VGVAVLQRGICPAALLTSDQEDLKERSMEFDAFEVEPETGVVFYFQNRPNGHLHGQQGEFDDWRLRLQTRTSRLPVTL